MKIFSRIIGVEGLPNLGIIEPIKIFRSAQPDWKVFKDDTLKIKTVINLREHSEKEEVGKLGMWSYEEPLNVFSNISVETFDSVIARMKDPEFQPVLIHCRQGHDRTGVICACYRMAINGWSYDEAIEEMKSYGYNDLWFVLTHSLKQYAQAKGLMT